MGQPTPDDTAGGTAGEWPQIGEPLAEEPLAEAALLGMPAAQPTGPGAAGAAVR